MKLNKKTIDNYQKNGVVLLKNIIEISWIKLLAKGVKKNFINPSKFKCVYEKKNNQEY